MEEKKEKQINLLWMEMFTDKIKKVNKKNIKGKGGMAWRQFLSSTFGNP